MNQVLALLFPAAYGTLIYAKNTKSEMKEVVLTYMINVTLTNAIIYLFMYHMYNIKKFNFTNLFTLKYILASSIISIIFGLILTLIEESLALKVEVKDKKEIKNINKKEDVVEIINNKEVEENNINKTQKKKETKKKEVKKDGKKKSIKNNK